VVNIYNRVDTTTPPPPPPLLGIFFNLLGFLRKKSQNNLNFPVLTKNSPLEQFLDTPLVRITYWWQWLPIVVQ